MWQTWTAFDAKLTLEILGLYKEAKRAALNFILIMVAKRHGVEPYAYLIDVLTHFPDYPLQQTRQSASPNWLLKS